MFKNPYYMAATPFVAALVLYAFRWGDILPALTTEFKMFIFLFLVLLIFMGFIFSKSLEKTFSMKNERVKYEVASERKTFPWGVPFILGLTMMDAAYSGGFPMFGSTGYHDFGIPTLHPIIVTINSFLIASYFFNLADSNDKRGVMKFSLIIIVTSLPFILELNRGMLIMSLMAGTVTFLSRRNIKLRFSVLIKFLPVVIVGLYLFGVSGNFRTNIFYSGASRFLNSNYIMALGEAHAFQGNPVVSPFYWSYIYITSALGNFQSTTTGLLSFGRDISYFVSNQFIPDFISKRLYPMQINMMLTQISPQFNAATVFNSAFYTLGWNGVYATMLYILFLPLLVFNLLKAGSAKYLNIGIGFLSTMFFFLIFSNMLAFSGLILPVIYSLILSIITRVKF